VANQIRAVRERLLECLPLGDIHLLETGALGHVLTRPGREVVDREDVVAALEEDLRDVRADEAGAPGDDDAQRAQA
jgi:hypothetical protein